MVLTPLDIQKKEFRKSFRGYSEEEVKDFLEKVAQSYEKVYRENQDLKEEIKFLKEKLKEYQELETTLKKAIILAEKAAEDLKKNAEKEKELILKNAQAKAEEIIEKAEARYRAINEHCEELKRQFLLFRTRFLNFLQSQIDLINTMVLDEESQKQDVETEEYIEQAAAGLDLENLDDKEEGETCRDGGETIVGGGDSSL
ncbi:MAG: DivIVA domain-containing protein [Thermosediminibacteraceae bacterium]|nr:DivIVA domain-containing protein [Thermosediminibacteraceae bacterium]